MKKVIRNTEAVLFFVGIIYCILIATAFIGISFMYSVDLKTLAGGFFVGVFTMLMGIKLLASRGKRRGRRR